MAFTATSPMHVVLERGRVPVASCDVVHAGAVLPIEIAATKTGKYPATTSLFVACKIRVEHVSVLRGTDLDASTRAHIWCFQPTAPPHTFFLLSPTTASAIYKSLPPDHALKRDALARTMLECWMPRPIAAVVADRDSTSPSLSISPPSAAVAKSELASSDSGDSASLSSSESGVSDVSGEDSESDASVVASAATTSSDESDASDAPLAPRKRAAPPGRRVVKRVAPLPKRAAVQPVPQTPVRDVTATLVTALPARLALVSQLVEDALASGARERVVAAETALSAAVRALVQ